MRLVLSEWLDSHVAVGGWKELEGFAPYATPIGIEWAASAKGRTTAQTAQWTWNFQVAATH
jgi:hypothetical protein